MHAGLVGALIDTACGFAAATITDGVLASHYSVNFFRPAVATRFIARGKILDAVTDKRLVASVGNDSDGRAVSLRGPVVREAIE